MADQLTLFDTARVEPHWVYVLARVDREGRLLYKIGHSVHPYKRARQLDARVIGVMPGDHRLERRLHHQFRSYRLPGTEWFWPGPTLRRWVEQLRAQWN